MKGGVKHLRQGSQRVVVALAVVVVAVALRAPALQGSLSAPPTVLLLGDHHAAIIAALEVAVSAAIHLRA